jgi:hypothetical protein
MMRKVYFENIIQSPESERSSLFSDAFPGDCGVAEYAAFKALESMQESWEDSGRELIRADVDFVTGTLKDTIACLTSWLRTWEAVVVADMEVEMVGELLRRGDFGAAAHRTATVKALVGKFDPAELKRTREVLSREYTKIEELVDAGVESA